MDDTKPYDIGRNDGGDFSHSVDFDEEIAHEESERIDRLAELLDADPQIETAFREDREFILLDAPDLDDATLDALVARAWEAAAG